MTANPILLQKKIARVIKCFADKANISLDDALKTFYSSELCRLIHTLNLPMPFSIHPWSRTLQCWGFEKCV